MTAIRKFIDAVCDGKNEDAASSFNTALNDRVRTHLDIKTVELSSSIYGQPNQNTKES